MPVRIALVGTITVSLLAPVLAPAALLVVLLIVGLPSFGTLFTPSAALLAPALTASSSTRRSRSG